MSHSYLKSMPALAVIDRLITSGAPPPAILSGLRSVLYERLGIETPQTPAGVAGLLGHLLKLRPGPFTPVVGALTGETVRVDTIDGTEEDRRLTGAEARDLGVPDDDALPCFGRHGLMMAGTTVAARVQLIISPGQVGDDEAVALIRKGIPCGAVLPGLTRVWRKARPLWPADPAVTARAVLHQDGRRFGFAAEHLTAGLVARLAELEPA
jgi:hypothetical protein